MERVYKVVSFSENRIHAIQNIIASPIVDKVEFTSKNKIEFSLDKKSIKEYCWKLEVNRLGQINKLIK